VANELQGFEREAARIATRREPHVRGAAQARIRGEDGEEASGT